MPARSALYAGSVVHRRLAPKGHLFRYRVFSLLIDLDEIDSVGRRCRLLSVNRWNLFSFFERDHGDGAPCGLKAYVAAALDRAGIDTVGLQVSLLCYPRVLGYVFNPLSVYFCRDAAGRLVALLYEVTNTFGERHSYLFRIDGDRKTPLRHACRKALYVSPFIGMDATYSFGVVPPGDRLAISIREADRSGPVLNASFTGRRFTLCDRVLARFALSYFLLGAKITAAIHWQAFRLWWKGIDVHRHKARKSNRITLVDQLD